MTDEHQEPRTLESYLTAQKNLASDNLSKDVFFYSLGINEVRSKRSEFGDILYRQAKGKLAEIIATPEGATTRKNLSAMLTTGAAKNGFAEDIEVTDSQVVYGLYEVANVGLQGAKLGDLEKIAKEKGAKLDISIPDALKNYSLLEMQYLGVDPKTPVEKVKPNENLSDKEKELKKNVENFYTYLKEMINTCGVSNMMKETDLYAGINHAGKKLVEEYNQRHPKST